MKCYYIYTLSDPDTHEPRYIGKTNNLKSRYQKHLNLIELYANTNKNNWIVSLLKNNKLPIMDILDDSDINNIKELEIYWISQFKAWGFNLTNMTNGGDGFDWTGLKHKPESILKMKLNHPLRKAVGQFTLNDKFVNKFISTHEAANFGFDRSHIVKVCNGKEKSHKGFIWKYIDDFLDEYLIENDIEIKIEEPKRRKIHIKKQIKKTYNSISIIQYDLNFNEVTQYTSINRAVEETGIHRTYIEASLNREFISVKQKNTTNRFIFRRIGEPIDITKEELENHLKNTIKTISSNKIVVREDLEGNIKEYDSIRKAAKDNNLSKTSISNYCQGKLKCKDYKFYFKMSHHHNDLSRSCNLNN